MVTVQDKINEVEAGQNYINGSLVLKHKSLSGVVLKWLETNITTGLAERKERFLEITNATAQHYLTWIVGNVFDIDPAK